MTGLCRVGEVAETTGVSIRTLHHYDRIGLLKPGGYSDGGHRLYSDVEILKLQQILTLRYLGFPLKRIGELLEQPEFDLAGSLRAQRQALRDRADELLQIESVIDDLLTRRQSNGDWDWSLIGQLTRTIHDHLHEKGDSMERYYTPEQMARFAELQERLPAEEIRAIEAGWTNLLVDVRAGYDLPPESPEAQELVRRWDQMQERTQQAYAGEDELWSAVGANIEAGNFEDHPQAPNKEDVAFIEAARQAASDV